MRYRQGVNSVKAVNWSMPSCFGQWQEFLRAGRRGEVGRWGAGGGVNGIGAGGGIPLPPKLKRIPDQDLSLPPPPWMTHCAPPQVDMFGLGAKLACQGCQKVIGGQVRFGGQLPGGGGFQMNKKRVTKLFTTGVIER